MRTRAPAFIVQCQSRCFHLDRGDQISSQPRRPSTTFDVDRAGRMGSWGEDGGRPDQLFRRRPGGFSSPPL
jgi:hypothetical protein